MKWQCLLGGSLAFLLGEAVAAYAQGVPPRLPDAPTPVFVDPGLPVIGPGGFDRAVQPSTPVFGPETESLPQRPTGLLEQFLPGAAAGNGGAAREGAAPQPKAPAPFGGAILERPKLTGDWLGCRTTLRDCGITLDVSTTQFYQGVAGGGLERSFLYGGRNDYFLTVDGEKLGLWKGFSIQLHGETRYGESANFITGALSPVNEYLLVPGKEGVVSGLTGVKFTQLLSENALVFAGKIILLDEIQQPLTGATGLTGFMNVSLIFNTILARTLPYSVFGAGFIYLRDEQPVFTVSVFDTRDASTTSVFNDFFDNGAVIFGTAILPTRFFRLPGHQGVEAVYSSGRYTNIEQSPYLDPLGGLVLPGTPKTGSWALGYVFDQALWVSPDDPKRLWGVFGRLGISDGNPNPIRSTAMGG
jgi:porin